jgi:uncharacterized membrane protein YphA (DoxX/SURF4 family)
MPEDRYPPKPFDLPYLVNHGFPSGITYPLAVLAALTEFLGGLAILLGLQTRAAALVLALFVLVAALIGHRFWRPRPRSAQIS